MAREEIDIRWIPKAKACWVAVQMQITFCEQGIERAKTQYLSRFEPGTFEYNTGLIRIQQLQDTLKLLRALLEGKTVA